MMDKESVELCIEITTANANANANANDNSPSPTHSQSLESSMSTYDSMMQSLHEELNANADADADFMEFEDIEDPDFFKMDCATAMSFDYEMNYTMKQLKHIAGYYGMKCKSRKVDIIQDIVQFEMDDKNESTVVRRKRMFHYIETLKNDDYFKSFIIL